MVLQRKFSIFGTGGGIWPIQMAQMFPWTEVLGVDLAPNMARPRPPNCRFELDDVNLGISRCRNTFDLVQSRLVAFGIQNFRQFLQDTINTLRPGGIATFIEGILEVYDEKGEVIISVFNDNPDGSHFSRLLFESFQCMNRRGGPVHAGLMMNQWLPAVRGIEFCHVEPVLVPIGTFGKGEDSMDQERVLHLGELMKQNCAELSRSLRPLLLAEGYFEETVDRLVHNVRRDILDPNNTSGLQLYAKWVCGYARKASGPPLPSPYYIPGGYLPPQYMA